MAANYAVDVCCKPIPVQTTAGRMTIAGQSSDNVVPQHFIAVVIIDELIGVKSKTARHRVMISSDLSLEKHVDTVCSKCFFWFR